jgi:PAS domain S-box-containing protein
MAAFQRLALQRGLVDRFTLVAPLPVCFFEKMTGLEPAGAKCGRGDSEASQSFFSASIPLENLALMKPSYLSDYEDGLKSELSEPSDPQPLNARVGILIGDAIHRRLVESASIHLELVPEILDEAALDFHSLSGFELIVADEPVATRIREALRSREDRGEGIHPAVIAVRQPGGDALDELVTNPNPGFDGILSLPMQPGPVAAQLSLILYAHRAFARRYQDAMEELHLNRRIFRSVTSGISVASTLLPDLPLTYVNPAFEVMTGYSLEEVQGQNCRFLQGSERNQPSVTLIREAIRDGREVTAILKNFRKDGTSFWNELSLSPIRNRDGEITHFVGIQTDVTARVEFEAALRESEKLAAVGRLASSIAHEINNPLESVMNLLYLAQQEESLPEILQYLGQADKQVQRVSLITSQSLRFYKQSTKPQAVRAFDLLESVLDLYETRAENSHVAIEHRDRSHESIVCLESEIRQVLNNLVRNAIEAMGRDGGRLLIRSRDTTDWRTGVPGVAITVADTGSGISPQTMQQLYRPFFTTKGASGTGLGLWISSEIVARHRGRLLVRSCQREGASGTVFMLFLPLQGPAS